MENTNLAKKQQKIFASNTTIADEQLSVFGSKAQTGTMQFSLDPNILQNNENWKNGWQNATIIKDCPFQEDFNTVEFVNTYNLAYLFQKGIPEYDPTTTYFKGSIVLSITSDKIPVIFYSKTDSNINNNPLTDTTNWGNLYDYISSLISGNFATNNLNNLTPEGKGKTFLGIDMTGGIDFNATTARGCYYIPAFIPGTTTNVAKANGPYSSNSYAGTLVVQNGDGGDTGYVFQEFNCVTDKLKWFRNKINGTWGYWIRQASGLPNYSAGVTISTNGAANVDTTSTYTPTVDGIIQGRVDINRAGSKAHLVVKDLISNTDILVIFALDNGDKFSSTVPVVAGMPYQITTNIGSASDISAAVFYPYMQ